MPMRSQHRTLSNETPITQTMKNILFLLLFPFCSLFAQAPKVEIDADRKYLVENLTRTRDLIVKETEGLSANQWAFKESANRWSISQVVEHLAYWEMIFARQVNIALRKQDLDWVKLKKPDSTFLNYVLEETPHTAPPFAVPLGLNEGKNNLTLFVKLRNEAIEFVKTSPKDFRTYFEPINENEKRDVHQIYLVVFGHVDRHLRQIKKVKADKNYPR
jgi:hypothetical protein